MSIVRNEVVRGMASGLGVVMVATSSIVQSRDPPSRSSVVLVLQRCRTAESELLRASGSSKLTHSARGEWEYAVGVG